MQEEHRYEDAFLSPTEFRWQSQNRTTRDSKMGRMIQNHRAEGTAVPLFVRPTAKVGGKTQPFIYCGNSSSSGGKGTGRLRCGQG